MALRPHTHWLAALVPDAGAPSLRVLNNVTIKVEAIEALLPETIADFSSVARDELR